MEVVEALLQYSCANLARIAYGVAKTRHIKDIFFAGSFAAQPKIQSLLTKEMGEMVACDSDSKVCLQQE